MRKREGGMQRRLKNSSEKKKEKSIVGNVSVSGTYKIKYKRRPIGRAKMVG